ncbi:MAG: response regulator [Lachnospiraceae bacterium]|nr:response regulator [Lachnospiraceae bacterium]
MELKILITGKNDNVASDLLEHLKADTEYNVVKCAPLKSDLFDALLDESPEVVIICLGDETSETITPFDMLKNGTHKGNCITIVIANEKDEKLFLRYTKLDRAYLLSRPVSYDALYEKLLSIEEEVVKEREKNKSKVREFINERPEKEYKRKHILVVDDDTDQLLNIREQLKEFYDVTLVRSGDDAFKFLKKKIPDLILLDYLMPEKDGSDVAKELREIEEYADIPIVFLTGMTERNAILDILAELKPQGFIIKPAKKSELVAKIIDVLG